MYRRPIVTLIGESDQITLDGVGHGFTLKPGMTGTGLAPRELTFSQLPQGGSILRHKRPVNRTIMLPIDVFHGYGEEAYSKLEDSRRRLERLCEDTVEIRLQTKDGTRSAYGQLKDGLEGDFAKAVVNGHRMVMALTFECEDPWFYGPWREQTRRIGKASKPFLSATSSFFPVRLSESSVQGEYDVVIEGDAPAWGVWEISAPGEDPRLQNLDTGEALFLSGQITEPVTVDTRPRVQDITSPSMPDGQWWDRAGRIVGGRLVEQDLFPLKVGKNRIRMTMVAANDDSYIRLRYQETYKAGH